MLSASPALGAGAGAGAAHRARGAAVDTTAIEQVLRDAGVVSDAPAAALPWGPGGLAPGSAESGGAESGGAASGGAALGSAAPGSGAGGSGQSGGAPSGLAPGSAPVTSPGPARVGTVVSTATVSVAAGLTVTAGANVVRMRPVVGPSAGAASGGAAISPAGLAVFGNGADSAFALNTAKTGANAGYVVIAAESAPTDYRFQLTVDGSPAGLRLAAEGAVDVLDAAGTVVNSIAPPWAKGADGALIATSYSVAGSILTQTVEHRGASYPVVADPLIRCDGLWCTASLSRAETRQMAAGSFAPAALCSWFGSVGRLCSTLFLGGWAHANVALATGQCSAFRVWQRNLVSWPHLAYVRCYA